MGRIKRSEIEAENERIPCLALVKNAALSESMASLAKLVELRECGIPEVEFKAAKEILDRAIGKAKESVELTGKDGGAILVRAEQLSDDDLASIAAGKGK